MDWMTFTFFMSALGCISYFLHRYLSIKERIIDHDLQDINSPAVESAQLDALSKQINTFDSRINSTWTTINETKQALESLKLQVGLKGINQ